MESPAPAPRLREHRLVRPYLATLNQYPSHFIWERGRLSAFPAEAGSTKSRQTCPSGCVWTRGFIANRGELLNRERLAPDLTDSALASHLFDRYGRQAPDLIKGPFAFIVWNARLRQLLATRDRLGIYGLFFQAKGRGLWIAEKPRDLPALWTPDSLNLESIALHLVGFPPRDERTFHRDVQALPPAGALWATEERRTLWRYWQAESSPTLRLESDQAYSDALRELLSQVVEQYRLSSTECGVTLSSGLDSTSVAALLANGGTRPKLRAFCWTSFDIPEADESAGSRRVADYLGLDTVDIPVGGLGPLSVRLESLSQPSEPGLGFYSNIWNATFAAVHEHGVATLFSGSSGDNLFGGPTTSYPDLLLTGRWRRLISDLRMHTKWSGQSVGEILRMSLLRPLAEAWLPAFATSLDRTAPAWLSSRTRLALPQPERNVRFMLPGRLQRVRLLEEPYLPEISRQLTLRASRFGIDFRHPFLDSRLFDFSACLPSDQTFTAGQRKGILRRAMSGLLPKDTLAQRTKIIPRAIAHRSLRGDEGMAASGLLQGMRAEALGLLDETLLRQEFHLFRLHGIGRPRFFHAMTLEAWLRRYF